MSDLTAQAIFDRVVTHLHKQNAKSKLKGDDDDKTVCAYRGAHGRMCAIGVLITNKEYTPEMEGNNLHDLRNLGLLPNRLIPFAQLLNDLQVIHDNYTPDVWKYELKQVAFNYKLTFSNPWEAAHASRS